MNAKYLVRPIRQGNDNQMVVIIYNGTFEESEPISVKLYNSNNVTTGTISAQDTGPILGPVCTGVQYQLEISDCNSTHKAEFSVNDNGEIENFKTDSDLVEAGFDAIASKTQMAAEVTYIVKNASGTESMTFTDLFRAINQARIYGTGSIVYLNNVAVFEKTTSPKDENDIPGDIRYYKYQFTAAYGYVKTTEEANSWLLNYSCSYIIRSDTARIFGANYKIIVGPGPGTEEPNSGGYYYQYGNYWSEYNKASMVVNLTQARLHLSENPTQAFNAYAFITVRNSKEACDLGVIFSASQNCWNTMANYVNDINHEHVPEYKDDEHKVCGASKNSSGELIADSDIKIEVEIVETGLIETVTNIKTGVVRIVKVPSVVLSSGGVNLQFILCVSYVPNLNVDSVVTPDFRCGGYFNNVQLTDCKLYKKNDDSGKNFYISSPDTTIAFIYNTDCCSVKEEAESTTVDIAYNRPYRT